MQVALEAEGFLRQPGSLTLSAQVGGKSLVRLHRRDARRLRTEPLQTKRFKWALAPADINGVKYWVRCLGCREEVAPGLLCPHCGYVLDKELRKQGWRPSASLRAELVGPRSNAPSKAAPPSAKSTSSKPPEGGTSDLILGFVVLIGLAALLIWGGIKVFGDVSNGPDASFEVADCEVNFDGSVTVSGFVVSDGGSGEVGVKPYVRLMGGEDHSVGAFDGDQVSFDSDERVPYERRVTLDGDEIPTGQCGAEIL